MRFEYYVDNALEWRWTLVAANNRKIADSGEGYRDLRGCLRGISLIRGQANIPIKPRPRLRHMNGRPMTLIEAMVAGRYSS